MKLNILKLGRCEYARALEIQNKLLKKRQEDQIEDSLILVEHPPIITMGKYGDKSNLLASKELLETRGIDLQRTNRGGDFTYHGYGQVVGYPIFGIRKIGIKNFVAKLEDVFLDLLQKEYGIVGQRHEKHKGVWIGDEKILAIGLAVKRGVSMHGFAFNVNTKLEDFKLILPCGLEEKGVTSLGKIKNEKISLEKINNQIVSIFLEKFKYDSKKEITLESI